MPEEGHSIVFGSRKVHLYQRQFIDRRGVIENSSGHSFCHFQKCELPMEKHNSGEKAQNIASEENQKLYFTDVFSFCRFKDFNSLTAYFQVKKVFVSILDPRRDFHSQLCNSCLTFPAHQKSLKLCS